MTFEALKATPDANRVHSIEKGDYIEIFEKGGTEPISFGLVERAEWRNTGFGHRYDGSDLRYVQIEGEPFGRILNKKNIVRRVKSREEIAISGAPDAKLKAAVEAIKAEPLLKEAA